MADNKLPENLPNSCGRRLTPKQKLALIRAVEEGRFSISEACRRYGISRFTFYKWKKRYDTAKVKEEKVLKALSPKKRTYLRPHHRRSANLFVREILEVVKRRPSLSSRRIAEHTSLSETGVWGVLRRIGLARQGERKQFQHSHLTFRPWLIAIFVIEYPLDPFSPRHISAPLPSIPPDLVGVPV